jgi:transcriptional regulator with XRE-family HTH domain
VDAKRSRSGAENLTEEQRAAVERIRARHRTPEYRSEEQTERELARRDFPPATPDPELAAMLAGLKAERERRGVSLTEMHERTGLDRATISKVENGHVPNPTWATSRAYTRALGLKIVTDLVPLPSATPGDVEFCDDASGAPCLRVPEEDSESLCEYLRSRGIVCWTQRPAENGTTEGDDRITIALAPETDRRRVRALTHRWKIQARRTRAGALAVSVDEYAGDTPAS